MVMRSFKISGRQISNGYQSSLPQTLQEHEQQVILFGTGLAESPAKLFLQTGGQDSCLPALYGATESQKTTASASIPAGSSGIMVVLWLSLVCFGTD